ncbi:hypothetical protein Tco_0787660 [Tanacetum coccineum]
MEQMTTLRDLVGQAIQKKEEEKRIAEEQAARDRSWKIPICYDDDEDNTIAIYRLQIEETLTLNVENLVPIPSESEGIPDKMCDVPLCENTTPLNALNEHSEIVVNSDDDNSSSDDDSPYGEDIDYVDASPPDVEIVSLEVVGIVDPEVERIDDDILLTIKDDILLLPHISLFFLEETNTFDNSIPESETFRFNLEEISSGSPTTHSELSLPDYKAFYVDNDHFKERSSGNTTTHVDFSQYDSFIFGSFDMISLLIPIGVNLYHEEFADELTNHALPELECVNVPLADKIKERRPNSLFAYVVWIFLAFLKIPLSLHISLHWNEDTIFDPGISMYHSFMPDVSHRSGTFMKFNVYPNHLNESPMEILSSTCSPMDQ